MRTIRQLQDLDVRGRRVFVRVDFNVPIVREQSAVSVVDDTRIRAALPTIRYLVENEARCILASHLGRPEGKPSARYSLEPVGQRLSELLEQDVVLTDDCIGDGARGLSQQVQPGGVLLLENLRFHAGEVNNSPDFAAKLLELCDMYVGDAFGTMHRAHASTSALPKLVSQKCVGFLVQKELEHLKPLRECPERPFVLVMGGAKVSDKIGVIEHFLDRVDTIAIGGAMAYAFLKASGHDIGNSLCDDRQVSLSAKLIKSAHSRGVALLLPVDHVVVDALDKPESQTTTPNDDIAPGKIGVDIGPKTVERFASAIALAKTIFWNGPMGMFEVSDFAQGSFALARAIANSGAKKLAGGGDVSAAISAAGLSDAFDFISTGGGATLEYLEGRELPGLKALEVLIRNSV